METRITIRKKVQVGTEEFKDLIQGCYYVDKTLLLKKLVDCPMGTSYLFTRPRRFGKSLTISMIQTFFEKGTNPEPYFKETKIFQGSVLCYIQNQGLAKPYRTNTAENPFLGKLLSGETFKKFFCDNKHL